MERRERLEVGWAASGAAGDDFGANAAGFRTRSQRACRGADRRRRFPAGAGQAGLVMRFDRMQLVQTRRRLTAPLTTARTFWRLGSKRRLVTLCA